MGDGRAEGLSAIGDGEQAAISLTPDDDGTGSGSLLGSSLLGWPKSSFGFFHKMLQKPERTFWPGPISTVLKKQSSDVWVVAIFFLVIDDMVALDCILNCCCNLHVPFYIRALCLKN